MRIKQWFLQRLANWLLRGVRVRQHDDHHTGLLPGYDIVGLGWKIRVVGELAPQLPEKPAEPPYVPKYERRTIAKHEAIRKSIQYDPAYCEHRKGGRWAPRGMFKNYNLSCFTFVDGSTQIKCLNCKTVWTPESPDWKEAVRMMNNSTNTPNACEQPIKIVKVKDTVSG